MNVNVNIKKKCNFWMHIVVLGLECAFALKLSVIPPGLWVLASSCPLYLPTMFIQDWSDV